MTQQPAAKRLRPNEHKFAKEGKDSDFDAVPLGSAAAGRQFDILSAKFASIALAGPRARDGPAVAASAAAADAPESKRGGPLRGVKRPRDDDDGRAAAAAEHKGDSKRSAASVDAEGDVEMDAALYMSLATAEADNNRRLKAAKPGSAEELDAVLAASRLDAPFERRKRADAEFLPGTRESLKPCPFCSGFVCIHSTEDRLAWESEF